MKSGPSLWKCPLSQVRFGRPGRALNGPTWSPVKGSSASLPPSAQLRLCDNDFSGSPQPTPTSSQATFLDGRAGNRWARLLRCGRDRSDGGFPNAGYGPASVMRRLSLNRSEPAKKSGQNIPKNRCRTTIAERMGETPAELPFIRDQVVCLRHDQAARSGPRKEARALTRLFRSIYFIIGRTIDGCAPRWHL